MLHLVLASTLGFVPHGPGSPGVPFGTLSLHASGVVLPLTPHPIDVDGDGDLDILVGNGFLQIQPPTMAILENDGRGNFRPSGQLLSPTAGFSIPRGTLLLDTAGDGALDAFVVYSDGHASLFPNDPARGFLPDRTTGPLSGTGGGLSSLSPTALAHGDLDGDGREEAIVALTQIQLFAPPFGLGIVTVFFDPSGAPRTTTASSVGGGEIGALELFEMTGDAHLDLVGLDTNGWLFVARGRGTGGFQAPVQFPLGRPAALADHLALGDIDSDGDIDVIVGYADRSEVEIFERTGPFAFASRFMTLTMARGGLQHLALRDMDGDAQLDLVTVEVDVATSNTSAAVHLGAGNGSFTLLGTQSAGLGTTTANLSVTGLAMADFDGNATPDLLLGQARTQVGGPASIGLLRSLFPKPYEARLENVAAAGTLGEPSIEALGPAVRGNPYFGLRIANGPAFAPLLVLSSPWTQEAFVDPAVRMLVVPVAFEPGILDAHGAFEFPIPIPNDPILHGEWGFAQAWIADPGAPNTVGIAATRRLAVRVGTRY